MDFVERQKRIIERLIPKSISHGQLDTFLIAVPLSETHVAPERKEVLKASLKAQGSNLIPLIVRRTEAYEEEEYEVVYGADWLLAAKEMDLEKVWVWVFDLTDEQAAATKTEMQYLVDFKPSSESASTPISNTENFEFEGLDKALDQRLKPIVLSLDKLAAGGFSDSSNSKTLTNDKLEQMDSRINYLVAQVEGLKASVEQLIPQRIDLTTASQSEVDDVLMEAGVSSKYRNAAIKAIEYWKTSGKKLTWSNLKRSAKKGSPESIAGFGDGTYLKLKKIGVIPDSDNG